MKREDEDIWAPPSASLEEQTAEAGSGSRSVGYRIFKVILAVGLSLVWAGLGQFYNRQWLKGLIMMGLSLLLWLVMLSWLVDLVSMVDAAVVAWRRTGDVDSAGANS